MENNFGTYMISISRVGKKPKNKKNMLAFGKGRMYYTIKVLQ